MFINEQPEQQSQIFRDNSWELKACLVIVFLLAALVRLDEIEAPGYAITREYNSAIIAHAFYAEYDLNLETWQREIAYKTRDQVPLLEPPLTEYLVSLIYRIVGQEDISFSRYLTSFFWLLGGVFFYKIVKILTNVDVALVAVAYYLFVPMGIKISRSFQPDSVMMLLLLISLYCIILYLEKPSWHLVLLAGVVTGGTLLLRPLIMFALFSAFMLMSLSRKQSWFQILNKQFLVFYVLGLVLPLAFYGYGIYISGSLRAQANLSFRPHLLTKLDFWQGWFETGATVAGHAAIITAILGFFFLPKNSVRKLVIGLIIGYIIFGMVFNYHIYSHDYYHIQLFPIIGICISPLLVLLGDLLWRVQGRYWWVTALICSLAALYFGYRDVRATLYTVTFEDPRVAREIGEAIGHNSRTVFVAYHYGMPLQYYGELTGAFWPASSDDPFYRRPGTHELSVQERINQLGFKPDYFVITQFDLFQRMHQDLKTYLESTCSARLETPHYHIYSHCQTLIKH